MKAREFDDIMRALPCACCGSALEPAYSGTEPVWQGGLLFQKVPGAKDGVPGWVIIKQTVCTNCLERLQMIADTHAQQELLDLESTGDSDADDDLYVCGGVYGDPDEPETWRFGVANAGLAQGRKPYVARGWSNAERLFNACKHHAHLYRLAAGLRVINCVAVSPEAEQNAISAPLEVAVPPEWAAAIRAVVAAADFSGDING